MASVATTFTTFALENRSGQLTGTHSWGTPSNAQTSNDVRAIFSKTGGATPWNGYTAYLTAKQLTALVPVGATIDGIKISIQRRKDINDGFTVASDSAIHIIKGGTVQTAQNKAVGTAYTTTDVSVDYGGAADLWGQTWSASDVNGPGFGVGISCSIAQGAEGNATVEIDAMTVEVFYTAVATSKGSMMLTGVGK